MRSKAICTRVVQSCIIRTISGNQSLLFTSYEDVYAGQDHMVGQMPAFVMDCRRWFRGWLPWPEQAAIARNIPSLHTISRLS